MESRVGKIEVSTTARGLLRYELEIWHEGLKKHRLLKSDDRYVIEQKARLQIEAWDEQWATHTRKNEQQSLKFAEQSFAASRKELAAERTESAVAELAMLEQILLATLSVDDAIDWDLLKDNSKFPEPKPAMARVPNSPQERQTPGQPFATDEKYQPQLTWLDKLIPSRKRQRFSDVKALFEQDKNKWDAERSQDAAIYKERVEEHLLNVKKIHQAHEAKIADWNERKAAYLDQQKLGHAAIDSQRDLYIQKQPEAILSYCELVLTRSKYPDYLPQEFELEYNESSKTLIVDYQLPAPERLPTLKSVKYVQSRDSLEETHISEAQQQKLYDNVLYQISLRTLHEIFEADAIKAIDSVVFNGIVTAINRSTGREATSCILSIRADKDEFMTINLSLVTPKDCFKSLKGVGSAKLSGLSAIAPIVQMRRDDARFVQAYGVANALDESINLAAIPWEDFEHLIREIFEQEFASTGGEVKVTQASRDGGVDAVAFDPDPIRGGKIVIQAKRWTNTVGVAAVRDLYGTMMNEGAIKGILVTTADYGPDSYQFANDKPLTLLNGANLLHLLEKHGHKARIDVKEAKMVRG